MVDHRKVGFGSRLGHDLVDGERHIGSGQRRSICELHVVTDLERPLKPIVGNAVVRRQIIMEIEFGVGRYERRLNQRLMHMLAASPVDNRVEARLWLRFRGKRDDDLLVLNRLARLVRSRRRLIACCRRSLRRCA